jgi:hypothetical protein
MREEKLNADSTKSKLLALSICVLLSVTLVGCDPARPTHISVQVGGDGVRATVCESITVNDLRLAVPTGVLSAVATTWAASGTAQLKRGDEFELFQTPPSGLTLDRSSNIELAELRELTIDVSGDPAGTSVYKIENVDDGSWVRWDGSVSKEACPQ